MTLLVSIMIKSLVLVDSILSVFVRNPSGAASLDYYNCYIGGYTAGNLTVCGASLVTQLGSLAVGGVGFLVNMLQAMNTLVPGYSQMAAFSIPAS